MIVPFHNFQVNKAVIRISICFTTLIMLAGSAFPVYADIVEWQEADGGNGHFYELVFTSGETITWIDAQTLANQRMFNGIPGHLMTVAEQSEDDFLNGVFQSDLQDAGGYAWIGLTDVVAEDVFEWVTGEEFSYTNWLPGEPNNLFNEDFVHYFAGDPGDVSVWGWNDTIVNVSNTRAYFVEYDPTSIPEPSSLIVCFVFGLCVVRR